MADLFLDWNADLAVDAKGDLLLSSGRDQTNQRIIRRLLTNPGDYLWNLAYGGGIALVVGAPADVTGIEATIRQQLALEESVRISPAPTVNVKLVDPARGAYSVDITYSDSSTGGSTKVLLT